PATGGYQAAVEALSTDGQTSMQPIGSAAPPTFSYSGSRSPAITINPSTVTAGTDTMVEITGFDTNFIHGRTTAGFGARAIFVRQAWVVGSGRLLVNIGVGQNAPATLSSVTVVTGLQVTSLATALKIQAANPGQMSLRTPILNQATRLAGVPVNGTAIFTGS